MVQKYLAMVAILGAIAAIGSIGMVAEHVKAFDSNGNYNGDCGQRGFSWDNRCGYEQHSPTISQVDCSNCAGNSPCTCANIEQGGFSPVSFQPDNCFWSYPVQCSSLLPNNIVLLVTVLAE